MNQAAIEDLTLNQALEANGYESRKVTDEDRRASGCMAALYCKAVYRKSDGKLIGVMSAHECWKWLREAIGLSP